MHSKAKAATIYEKRRMEIIGSEVGCIACRQDRRGYVPPQIHHLLSGGRRRGHSYTVGLCPWHHEGYPPTGLTIETATELAGPSLAHNSRQFHDKFGTDDEMLDMTNERIDFIYGQMRP